MKPTITRQIPRYNPIGDEELAAAASVIASGKLSGFIGSWCPEFYGGSEVQSFENEVESKFGVNFAVAVNSWTSGLIAAIGALDIEPGDEVIVPTWTMSATAMAALHWNAIPIFADIDSDTFCISPKSVKENISDKTKAIIAVDIFGQSADIQSIRKVIGNREIAIISDSAQAPGAQTNGLWAGTLADIGGFSLNYHKHINTGEGGILVTNDSDLARRLQLLRNHAESVVEGMGVTKINNMIGFNFRMGEIEAAIGREQLRKLDKLVEKRTLLANRLSEGLQSLEGLKTPKAREGSTHVYYKYALTVNQELDRNKVFRLLQIEGVPGLSTKYVNLHLLPVFQKKMAYGTKGFPWSHVDARKGINYGKGICPNAELMQDATYLGIDLCEYDFSMEDIDAIVEAFHKVWKFIL